MSSVQEFWNRLIISGLASPEQLAGLQVRFAAFQTGAAVDERQLADWLVSIGALTRDQAQQLLAGRCQTFQLGDFQVQERIVTGRLAGQLRAVHLPTGHPVVLVAFDPIGADRWQSICDGVGRCFEIEAAHLVIPHELIQPVDEPLAVIEDLGGTGLQEVLSGGNRLSVSQAAAITEAVARGLVALHATGLAHGDLQPQNICLPRKGATRLVTLPPSLAADTARPPLDTLQADYAAPEIDANAPLVTAAADIYALGCTLYQMLAGQPPFYSKAGESLAEKMQRHAFEPIRPLEEQGVASSMSQIVSYMMAKDRTVRYASAATLVEAVHRFVAPEDASRERPPSEESQNYQRVARARRMRILETIRDSTPSASKNTLPASGESRARRQTEFPGGRDHDIFSHRDAAVAEDFLEALPTTTGSAVRQKPKSERKLLVVLAVSILVAVATAIMIFRLPEREPNSAGPTAREKVEGPQQLPARLLAADNQQPIMQADPKAVTGPRTGPAAANENLLVDDGKRLWGSPTSGPPPDIRYLPPGPQLLLMIRPDQFSGSEAQRSVLEALGPAEGQLREAIRTATGFTLEEIRRLDVAVYDEGGKMKTVLVVYLPQAWDEEKLLARWENPSPRTHSGTRYFLRGERGFYLPPGRTDVFATGGIEDVKEIVDWLDEKAQLFLDHEQQVSAGRVVSTDFIAPLAALAESADEERQFNLLFSPNFVRSARESLYPGRWAPLQEAISWLLGPDEEIQAGLLSLHRSDKFFAELRLYSVRDKRPDILAAEIQERLAEIPRRLAGHLQGLTISEYSQRLLASLPEMFRALHQYTRHDRDRVKGRQAVLRTYLPASAAAHLLMAGDLALLETAGTAPQKAGNDNPLLSLEEKLEKRTSLSFDQDNLLQALTALGEDLGLRIEIQGQDLEKEGITKNQSFGIDRRHKTGREILTGILRLANPDQEASGPADPRQKLIYVLRPPAGQGSGAIWITTRRAANGRGDKIPAHFQPGS